MASSARLDELKKKFDENPRRYFAPLANEHRKSGDLDQAIALCRTHLPQQPGHISGHIVLAQALFEAGSLDEAREIFHTALGLDPENLIALRYLGDIAKEAADFDTARQWYERVLEVDPRNEEIEQLVRDLDSPRAATPEPSAQAEAEPVAAAPPAPSHAAPPPPPSADHDARFAPLSLDDLDVGDVRPASPEPNDVAGAAGGISSEAWGASDQGADASMLDAPDMDLFDLDPAGTVEALLDAHAPAASDGFFLTELSGSNAPIAGDESELDAASAPSESWAAHSNAVPDAMESAADANVAFEEGSFYLEPPPPEPVTAGAESDVTASGHVDSTAQSSPDVDQVGMPGLDAFVAEYSLPETEPYARAGSPDTLAPVSDTAPNDDAPAHFTERETAEWQAPGAEPIAPAAQGPDDVLGLEVMEFVPPSREPSSPLSAYVPTAEGDPMLGRTVDAVSGEQGATPAAFVTETMAELYLQQGFRSEALGVYRELLARNPADDNLRDRIAQIESGSLSSIGMAAVSENVVESALKRQSARPTRSVRSFFASLAGRRVTGARQVDEYSAASEPATEAEGSTIERSDDASPETLVDSTSEPTFDASLAGGSAVSPPLSAAETLASFDPFADTADSAAMPHEAADETPNAPASAPSAEPIDQVDATDLSSWAVPTAEMPTPQSEPAPRASDATEAARSLEGLFPETPVAPRTDAAAQTFATAFGRDEPQGRPTRAASNELSLDNVFRGAPEGAPPTNGGFSFDQFFSDSRSPGGEAAASAATTHEAGRSNGSGDAHDIEQFTAWLEGLKKK